MNSLGWQEKMGRRLGKNKPGRKMDRAGYKKIVSGFMGTAGAVCITAAVACSGIFMVPAQAAPARLRSAEAAIYEQANEGSNTVGNLVEGSTFEYVGDVTAEDGSVWHQVTTASGAAGYIKGDREIEAVEEEPAPEGQEGQAAPEGQGNPESQEAPEGEGGNGDTAPEGNGPAEGDAVAEENRDGEADGDGGGEEAGIPEREEEDTEPEGEAPETPEEGQPEDNGPEDGEGMAGSHSVQNNRAKSYSLDSSGRIKGKGNIVSVAAMDMEGTKDGKPGRKADLTVLFSVAVIFSSAGMVSLCWKRIKRLRAGGRHPLEGSGNRLRRKNEKKKHSQKRKGRKK